MHWWYWLIAVVVGPTLATLAMLAILRLDSDPLDWFVLVVGPVLFGAVFAHCARDHRPELAVGGLPALSR